MVTGVVCVLDALGTKGVWSIDEPEVYLSKLRLIHQKLNEIKRYNDQYQSIFKLNFSTFSDTIIITADCGASTNEGLIPSMVRIIDGVFSLCLYNNLLMRGAMSYGRFMSEGNIIIGPAIDDAAQWHDQAQLIGCLLTPNTSLLYDVGLERWNRESKRNDDYSQYAIKYPIPVKGGSQYDLYQVNWPLSYHKALQHLGPPDTLVRLKETLGKYPIPADAYKKHENTISFFNHSLLQRNE